MLTFTTIQIRVPGAPALTPALDRLRHGQSTCGDAV